MISNSASNVDIFDNVVVGTCMSMCPHSEMKMRMENKLLHSFEVENGRFDSKGRPYPDPERTVKWYSRPAAGKTGPNPDDIRPPKVLQKTVDYLLSEVVRHTGCHWAEVYDFIFDRLRAVRQDMVMQDIAGLDAIVILEKIVRFHIYAGYRLCVEPISVFDPKINNQHTQECLKRLIQAYNGTQGPHFNQPEFESIYLLFNLGSEAAMTHYFDLPKPVRENDLTSHSHEMSVCYMLGNYVRVLRLLECLPSVTCMCAAHRHLSDIQSKALCVMSVGFSSKNILFPLDKLTRLLSFNCMAEAGHRCRSHGITVSSSSVSFLKSTYKQPSSEILPLHCQHINKELKRRTLSVLLTQPLERDNMTGTTRPGISDHFSDMSLS